MGIRSASNRVVERCGQERLDQEKRVGAKSVCPCLVRMGSPWRRRLHYAVCILACPLKILGLETSFNLIHIHQPIMSITISFDQLALSLQKPVGAYIRCGLLLVPDSTEIACFHLRRRLRSSKLLLKEGRPSNFPFP